MPKLYGDFDTKTLIEPAKLRIISLLAFREMTTTQLAQSLNLTVPTIHHHIKHLLKAGIIRTSRLETTKNLIRKFYRLNLNHGDLLFEQSIKRLSLKERRKLLSRTITVLIATLNRALEVTEKIDVAHFAPGGALIYILPAKTEVHKEVWLKVKKLYEELAVLEQKYISAQGRKSIILTTLLPFDLY